VPFRDLPRSLAILAPPLALLIMASARWLYRDWQMRHKALREGGERVLLYGAGELGYQLVRVLQTQVSSPYRVVALLDDDRAKRNLHLAGVPVAGTRDDLARVAQERNVRTVILAIGNADSRLVREVEARAREAHLTLKVLPHASLIAERGVRLSDVRDVQICDILGRREIQTDCSSIAGYLTGRRVLTRGIVRAAIRGRRIEDVLL
jgi:dTDP-glucose 4,6-dehydratase